MTENERCSSYEEELLVAKAKIKELENLNNKVTVFDDKLYHIKESMKFKHGLDFFNISVCEISKAINANYVLVGILDSDADDTIQTISLCKNGEIIDDIKYPLTNSPCENVFGKELMIFPNNLQELFPNDSLLKDLNIQGYIGVALFDSEENPNGVFVALYEKPIEDQDYCASIMNFFEDRIANELDKYMLEVLIDIQQEEIEVYNQKSIDQFTKFLANIKHIAVLLDADGNIMFCNDYLLNLAGYNFEEIQGKCWFDSFIPERYNQEIQIVFKNTISENEVSIYHENSIKFKSGEERIIKWTNTCFYDTDGNISAIASIGDDVTEKRINEQKIKDSEERYKALANATSEAIFISENGYCIESNQKACEMFGYEYDELIGIFGTDVIAEESKELVKNNMLSGKEEPYEALAQRKDGAIFPALFHGKMFEFQGNKTRVTTIRDISLRKEAMTKLISSEEKFSKAFRINPMPSAITETMNGTYIDVNDAFCQLCEYTKQEIIGKSSVELGLLTKEQRLALKEEAIRNKGLHNYDLSVKSKNGKIKNVLLSLDLFKVQEKELSYFVIVDETEKRQNEKALIESEKKYRLLAENSTDVIWILDIDTSKFTYVSPSVEHLRGYTLSEVMQQSLDEAITPTSQELLKIEIPKGIEEFKSGIYKTYIHEIEQPCKDGSTVWTETTTRYDIDKETGHLIVYGASRNISERKLSEEALRDSEKKYRELIELLPDGIIVHKDGLLVFANQSAANILRYDSSEGILGKPAIDFVHPDYRQLAMERIQKAFMDGKPIPVANEVFIRKDNTYVELEVSAPPILFENEKAIQVIFRDITERKNAEKALKESEEKYKKLSEDMPVYISTFLPDGTLTYANHTLAVSTGLSQEQLMGLNFFEMISPEDLIIVKNGIDELSKENPVEIHQQTYKISNDEIGYQQWRNRGIFDDNEKLIQIHSIGIDITEQKKAEEALKTSEAKYRDLVEKLPDGLVVHKDGVILYANKATAKILKYDSPDELIGLNGVNLIHPDYREIALNRIKNLLIEGSPVEPVMEIYLCKDNTEVPVEVYAQLIQFEGENAIQLITRDISDRIKSEKALKESEEKYRALVTNALEGIVILDFEGTIIFSNHAIVKTLEMNEVESIIGKKVFDFIEEDSFAKVAEDFGNVLNGKDSYISEYRCHTAKGNQLWLESIGKIIQYEGKPAVLVSLRDITERKIAERELLESEENNRILIQNSQSIIYKIEPDGTMTFVSPSWKLLLGHEYNEVVGKNFKDFVNAEDIPECELYLRNSLENPSIQNYVEYRVYHKDGSMHWHRSHITAVKSKESNKISFVGNAVDFTERKIAEAILKQSEEKFRTLFETMSQGVVYHASDGKIISANQAAQKILGLTLEQLLGSSSFDPRWKIIKEDGSNLLVEEQASMIALATGMPVNNVIKGIYHPTKDDYVWVSVDAVPQFKNGDKRPFQVYAIFNDITERRNNLLAMEESEKKYRQVFNTLTDALLVIDYDGTILDVNPATINLYGYSYDELVGLHASQLITTDYHHVFRDFVQSIIKFGTFHGDTIDKRKDGSTFLTDVIGTKIQYKGKFNLLAIIRDVTDSKNAQTILEESEKRFRSLFENMDAGFVLHEMIFDNNGDAYDYFFIEINDSYEKLTGLKRENVIGKTVREVLPGTEEDSADWIGQYGKVVKTGQSLTFESFSEVLNKWYGVTAYKSTGNQFAVIVNDITQRKEIEQRIKSINEELELKVKDRTAQLEDAMLELSLENDRRKEIQDDLIRYQNELHTALEKEKELNQLKSAFMSMVSHQYRTPLTVIQTATELLSRSFAQGNKERHDKHTKNISQSVDRMVEMLEKIMTIGKSDMDEKNIIPEDMELNEVVYRAIEDMKVYDKNAHEIILNNTSETINLHTVLFFVEQILNNLLSNALKYSPKGTNVHVNTYDRNEYAKIEIIDEGIGIPEADKKHIWDHFFRASNVENIYGTGLGLSIVKRFADSIKGELFIDSEQDKGTKITLLIPKK